MEVDLRLNLAKDGYEALEEKRLFKLWIMTS
jgi:hypothetical protein